MFSRVIIPIIMASVLQIFSLPLFAAGQIAITIDDLPFVGKGNTAGNLKRETDRFSMVRTTLRQEKVPTTGFVIAGFIGQRQWQQLEDFLKDGHLLGNHTYQHKNLDRMNPDNYIDDIAHADNILEDVMSKPKYFRYPYLATGRTCEAKFKVRDYLNAHDYEVAPVSIDSKDYKFNKEYYSIPYRQREARLPALRARYLNFVLKETIRAEETAMKQMNRPIKHILLIHMNTLNSIVLPDLIKLFRDRGYEFITLPEALTDPYYNNITFRDCDRKLAEKNGNSKLK